MQLRPCNYLDSERQMENTLWKGYRHSIAPKNGDMQVRLSRIPDAATQDTGEDARTDAGAAKGEIYTVKKHDTLWDIARNRYKDGSKSAVIYTANKETIEDAARKHGRRIRETDTGYSRGPRLVLP